MTDVSSTDEAPVTSVEVDHHQMLAAEMDGKLSQDCAMTTESEQQSIDEIERDNRQHQQNDEETKEKSDGKTRT